MTDLRWLLLFSPQCLTPRVSAWQTFYLWPIQKYLPNNLKKHPIATPCFSTAAAAASPSASHPGCRGKTALHGAAQKGHCDVVEQLISAKATVDAANDDGRGPGRVFGPFWECLWRDDGRGSYMGRWFSAMIWDVEWYSYLLLQDPLLWWDGPLEIRVKKWDETSRTQKESRGLKVFTWFVCLMILSLIPHLSLKLWSPYGTNFDSRAVRYFHCQR